MYLRLQTTLFPPCHNPIIVCRMLLPIQKIQETTNRFYRPTKKDCCRFTPNHLTCSSSPMSLMNAVVDLWMSSRTTRKKLCGSVNLTNEQLERFHNGVEASIKAYWNRNGQTFRRSKWRCLPAIFNTRGEMGFNIVEGSRKFHWNYILDLNTPSAGGYKL